MFMKAVSILSPIIISAIIFLFCVFSRRQSNMLSVAWMVILSLSVYYLLLFGLLSLTSMALQKKVLISLILPLIVLVIMHIYPKKVRSDPLGMGFMPIDLPESVLWCTPGILILRTADSQRFARVESQDIDKVRSLEAVDTLALLKTENAYPVTAFSSGDDGFVVGFRFYIGETQRIARFLTCSSDGEVRRDHWINRRNFEGLILPDSEPSVQTIGMVSGHLAVGTWESLSFISANENKQYPSPEDTSFVTAWPDKGILTMTRDKLLREIDITGHEVFITNLADHVPKDAYGGCAQPLSGGRLAMYYGIGGKADGDGWLLLDKTGKLLGKVPADYYSCQGVVTREGISISLDDWDATVRVSKNGERDSQVESSIQSNLPKLSWLDKINRISPKPYVFLAIDDPESELASFLFVNYKFERDFPSGIEHLTLLQFSSNGHLVKNKVVF